jgi:DNA-binding NarL/FixJ family response regulator
VTKQLSVLLVAKPGPLRYGLRALLSAVTPDAMVVEAESTLSALTALDHHHFCLALVDSMMPLEETRLLLDHIGSLSPKTARVFLADTVEQKQAIELKDAEVVLLRGTPGIELAATVERLLSQARPDATEQ